MQVEIAGPSIQTSMLEGDQPVVSSSAELQQDKPTESRASKDRGSATQGILTLPEYHGPSLFEAEKPSNGR